MVYQIESIQKEPPIVIDLGYEPDGEQAVFHRFSFDHQVDWTPEDIKQFSASLLYLQKMDSLRKTGKVSRQPKSSDSNVMLDAIEVLGRYVDKANLAAWKRLTAKERFAVLGGYATELDRLNKETTKAS